MERKDADLAALQEALRHGRAALDALAEAERSIREGNPYPTYLHIAAAELAHAIEMTMQVALRNRDIAPSRRS